MSTVDPWAWMVTCRELVDAIIASDDSEPFRVAVDPEMYPEYYQTIDNPMDLAQVKEKLDFEQYANPLEFHEDMKLMFSNSRTFNTNKRSRIYAMTLRLSAMYEDRIKLVLEDWKDSKVKHKGKGKSSKNLPAKRSKLSKQNNIVSTRSARDLSSQVVASASHIRRTGSSRSASRTGIAETVVRDSQPSTSGVPPVILRRSGTHISYFLFYPDFFAVLSNFIKLLS